MSDIAAMIAEFHAPLGQRYGDGGPSGLPLRRDLHEEEANELADAIDSGDRVWIAQELADVVYVAYGTAYSLGIDLDAVIAEVHRANLSKFTSDGQALVRADGKVLKGDAYSPPDVAGVLAHSGDNEPQRRLNYRDGFRDGAQYARDIDRCVEKLAARSDSDQGGAR